MKILQLTTCLWIKICQSYFPKRQKGFTLSDTFKKPFHIGRMCLETAETGYAKSEQTENSDCWQKNKKQNFLCSGKTSDSLSELMWPNYLILYTMHMV